MSSNIKFLEAQGTGIDGLVRITPRHYPDERGSFTALCDVEELEKALGISFAVKGWNESESRQGTIRGIHAEPWAKLIRLTAGEAEAAIVELRDNVNYGRVEQLRLKRGDMLYVPAGLGNSFQALDLNETVYQYLVSGQWQQGTLYAQINPFDVDLGINWPLAEYILSDKDRNLPPFSAHDPTLYQRYLERRQQEARK